MDELRMTITILDRFNDLENLRKIVGFSREVVANEIGVRRMTYHHWASGKHIPNGRYEPEIVRTLLWMQGLVRKKADKEKRDARSKPSGDNV